MYVQINHSSINKKKKKKNQKNLGHEYKLPCSQHTEISVRSLLSFSKTKGLICIFPTLSTSLSYQSNKNYAKLAEIIPFLHLPWERAAVSRAIANSGCQSDSSWLLIWHYGNSCWITAICYNQVLTKGNDKIPPKPNNISKEGFLLISVLLVLFQALIRADFQQENTGKVSIWFYLRLSLQFVCLKYGEWPVSAWKSGPQK